MKKLGIILAIVCLLALPAHTASAKVIDSAGNKFDMAQDVLATSPVEGDYVAFGLNVTLESGVSGDIFAFGRNVAITDEGSVQNIITAGQVVNIRAAKVRNIYAAGGDVTVGSGTEVGGVYIVGANVTFSGTAQDVVLGGTSVTVDGTVYGNLTIRSDDITFGGDVTVGGKITVVGTVKPEMPPTIDESQVTFRRIVARQKKDEPPKLGISRMAVIMSCVSLVTAVLFALILTLLRGDFFRDRAQEFKRTVGRYLLYGLLAFIVVPVVAFAFMFTVIAIPISVIVLVLYGILLYLAPILAGIILARLILPRMNRYLAASIGAVVLTLLMMVPYLKILIFLFSSFYILGAAIRRLKPHREAPPPEAARG
jgi:hypothetical protein